MTVNRSDDGDASKVIKSGFDSINGAQPIAFQYTTFR